MNRKDKRNKKEKRLETPYEFDETFAFIVGYTSGGFPYGITWEEMNGIEAKKDNENETDDLELPFD